MAETAPVDATESVVRTVVHPTESVVRAVAHPIESGGRAPIIRKSFESLLGLLFIVVGVLIMVGSVSIASGGQNTEIKNSSGQDSYVHNVSSQDLSVRNSSSQASSGPLSSATERNSQTALAGAAITPGSGTVANGVYSNEYFNFSYRLPEQQSGGNSFTMAQKDLREDMSDTQQDGAKKYLLLEAAGATNNSVQLVAIDTTEEPRITPSDIVVAEMAALRSLGGRMIGAAAEKEMGGRTFSIGKAQVNGEVRGASATLYAGFAAVKQGSYVLTWTFFADSPGRLEQLLGTLETVSFEK